MKKLTDFIIILLMVAASIAFRSLFVFIGWDILTGILATVNLPVISYLGWFGIMSFLYMLTGHFGTGSNYTLDEIKGNHKFFVEILSSTTNKLFALALLFVISLFI